MTYGEAYDEALRKIAHLEETNGALCAEINRQERVIERQRADIERQDEYRQRIVRDVIRLSEALGVKIVGTDTEIIARDIEAVEKRDERITDLESLVMDMYESMNTVSEVWAYDTYAERIADIGLEV